MMQTVCETCSKLPLPVSFMHLYLHKITAVTIGFTEMTYSGDETDVTTTLECIVIMTGQLERNLLIDISTEDGSTTGLFFN